MFEWWYKQYDITAYPTLDTGQTKRIGFSVYLPLCLYRTLVLVLVSAVLVQLVYMYCAGMEYPYCTDSLYRCAVDLLYRYMHSTSTVCSNCTALIPRFCTPIYHNVRNYVPLTTLTPHDPHEPAIFGFREEKCATVKIIFSSNKGQYILVLVGLAIM